MNISYTEIIEQIRNHENNGSYEDMENYLKQFTLEDLLIDRRYEDINGIFQNLDSVYSSSYKFYTAFYNIFKHDLHASLKVGSMESNWRTFKDLIVNRFLTKYDETKNKLPAIALYLNDLNLISENGIININDWSVSAHSKGTKIPKAFNYGFTPILFNYFHEIADDPNYQKYFLTFLEQTKHDHNSFIKGIEFYNTNKGFIEHNIKIKDNEKGIFSFASFINKDYINIINNMPEALTKVSPNIENTKYLLSLVKDKEAYLQILYNGRNKKHLSLKEKGLYNSTSPILYAAYNSNIDFINLMVDYGYQLNDDEKLYIKHKELNEQVNSFEDNFISDTLFKFKNKSADEFSKHLYRLHKQENITDHDFNILYGSINLTELSNKHYLLKYSDLNITKIIELYLKDQASVIDVILLHNPIKIINLEQNKLSMLQKIYFKNQVDNIFKSKCRHSNFDKNFYIKYLSKVQNKINKNIISDIYLSKLLGNSSIEEEADQFFSKIINKEELLSQYSLFINSSLNMHIRYLNEGGRLTEEEKQSLSPLLSNIYAKMLRSKDSEESKNYYIKFENFIDKLALIDKEYTGILFNFIKNNEIDSESQSIIEKISLKNILNNHSNTIIKKHSRL